jgi:hypothetical protein
MEDRLDLALQPAGHHRLGDPVRDGRHAKNPDPLTMRLRYPYRLDRGREVAARGHPVPDLVQVALQIRLELPQRHLIHPWCAFVRLDLLVRLPDLPLGDRKRLP